MPIKNRFAELAPQITEWRRDLHANPEVLYDLPRTSAFVAEKLRAFGCDEVVTGIGISGVVGVIRGRSNTSGKVIGLRADMDALPMSEETGLDYASQTLGKMHACGHDGHTAVLLGATQYLCETRNFDGTAIMIFQPAEEGGAGAQAMIDDGLMERFGIQEVYGMHNLPGVDVGKFVIRTGAFLASSDAITITVTGKGGHAARPHQVIDTNLVAAHIVVALQSIVSRNADPLEALVVSICGMQSDNMSHNIIPHKVVMKGTVRALSKKARDMAVARIPALVSAIAEGFGATAEVEHVPGYPVTMNSPEQTAFAVEVAREIVGPENVDTNFEPQMPAEDFAFMLESRPGAYIMYGNGDSAACHHPAYDFADEAIPMASSWFAGVIERRLPIA